MTIVALVQSACKQLSEIDVLTQQKQNADNIRATYNELSATLRSFDQVRQRYYLLQAYLDLEEIKIDVQKMSITANNLRQQFVEGVQLRQVQELRSIQSQLSRIGTKIDVKWKSYAEGRLKGLFDLLEVVRQLPEMQSKVAAIRGLENRLRGCMALTPVTQRDLADFDQGFTELQKYTSQVQNLPEEVLAFLKKVHEGKATMADVTDEVIRWCRQGEHAHSFKISLSFY